MQLLPETCHPVGWSIKNASFDLGDLPNGQPAAEVVAALAQVLRRRLGGRTAAGLARREMNTVHQGAEPVVGTAAQDFSFEVDNRNASVLGQLSQHLVELF